MPLFQNEELGLAVGPPGWMGEVLVWIVLVGSAAAVVAAAGIWVLAARVREFGALGAKLDHIEGVRTEVARLVAERGDLDLRRIEHVLIELRDGQQRLEDALLRHAEATRGALERGHETQALTAPGSNGLGERAINRLLALGYERVQLVTRTEKLAELASKDGEILAEARREGVLHKGRVLVRGGRISEVEMHPIYSIFP